MRDTEATLELSPRRAVRVLAIFHLEDARRATKRLPSTGRLHDFRVALRRLRTLVRVHGTFFDGAVGRRSRRRMRALSRKSSRRRDAQAQLALLAALNGLSSNRAAARVAERLQKRVVKSKDVPATLKKDYRKLDRKLRRRLQADRELNIAQSEPTFGEVAVVAAGRLGDALSDALDQIGSAADEQALHRARLAAKRLRYTLEPLQPANAAVTEAIASLIRLQDLLGDARDMGNLRELVVAERANADESLAADFDTLTSRLQVQADLGYTEFQKLWLDGNGKWFFQGLQRALTAIAPRAVPS